MSRRLVLVLTASAVAVLAGALFLARRMSDPEDMNYPNEASWATWVTDKPDPYDPRVEAFWRRMADER